MKKKFTVKSKSLLFYWLFLIVAVNETHGAVKIAFTSPIQLLKGYRNMPSLNFFHQRTTNDMKVHIKKVLNMHLENSTLDNYISSIFNLNNVNPQYVFRLPDNKNRTLIFRKSDFTAAVFPNITNVNKFSKTKENLQTSSSIKHPVKVKNEELNDELKHERFIFENNLTNSADDFDDNMKKIVDENVRSEKDFIDLMTELNEDLNDEDLREKYHQRLTQPSIKVANKKPIHSEKLKSKKKSEEEEWEELGLSGWSGTVSASKEVLPRKEKSKQAKKISTALVPIYQNFDPLAFLKLPSSLSPPKKPNYYQPPPASQESEFEMEYISDQLSTVLLKDEQVLLNRTGRLPNQKPRWPITTTRDQHGDNDVFLARANNPFGHSTKWKYNNSTEVREPHREGRSKRGVFHLYSMIKCATGCDPLVYKGYGCYCGFLGNGKALDGIDRCCKAHDYCYTSANCIFYTEYFVPYLWKCYRGKPLCAIDNGEWGGPGSCATRLCQCDLALSRCLRHYYCPKKRPVCVSSPFRLLQNLVMVF